MSQSEHDETLNQRIEIGHLKARLELAEKRIQTMLERDGQNRMNLLMQESSLKGNQLGTNRLKTEFGDYPVTGCQYCKAIIASPNGICERCLVQGAPAEERAKRISTISAYALSLLVHFPVMLAFRIALYCVIGIPVWLWILFGVETLIWCSVTIAGMLSHGRTENIKTKGREEKDAQL